MTLLDYLRLLRRRWLVVAGVAMLGLVGGAAYGYLTPGKYEARARLFVSPRPFAAVAPTPYNGGELADARLKSYAQLATSPEVLRKAAATLSSGVLRSSLSSSVPETTSLVEVLASGGNARTVARDANAVAEAAAVRIRALETSPGKDIARSLVLAKVAERAVVPGSPYAPKPIRDLLFGLTVGLALGVALALLTDLVDTRVKNIEVLRERFDLVPLGRIGVSTGGRERSIVVLDDPRSPQAEDYRQLRTNLQFLSVERRPRSIVVTSSVPEEGKSTVACNVAVAMAQAGESVISSRVTSGGHVSTPCSVVGGQACPTSSSAGPHWTMHWPRSGSRVSRSSVAAFCHRTPASCWGHS